MSTTRAKGAVHYLSKGLRRRIREMLEALYSEGWRDADYMARQVTDDLCVAGSNMQFRQHLVEQMARELLAEKRGGLQSPSAE